jgi:hypothetical protein
MNYRVDNSNELRTVLEALLAVFVIFKLTGDIDWPWVYVLMPFWIPLIISIFIMLWLIIVNYGKKR